MKKKSNAELIEESREVRKKILDMIVKAHASHIASSFSCVELLVYLYNNFLNISKENFQDPNRDRFILSKGWGVSTQYVMLAHRGIISEKLLEEYCADGSKLVGISTRNGTPGIEATTGSMGHGLPIGVGMAKAAKLLGKKYRVVVVMSDGECDEGSSWEAILQAGHMKLDNLLLIIDHNKWQSFGRVSDILDLSPLADKFNAFKWNVREIDGHDFEEIDSAVSAFPFKKGKPSLIIAHTIKGKGVSVLENKNEWHYKTPTELEIKIAQKEL